MEQKIRHKKKNTVGLLSDNENNPSDCMLGIMERRGKGGGAREGLLGKPHCGVPHPDPGSFSGGG